MSDKLFGFGPASKPVDNTPKPESEVQQLVQIRAKYYDCTLMRNNCGCLLDAEGRPVRFGLGNISKKQQDVIASSDLIGFTKITITPDMVGKEVAIFTAVEVKKEAWKSDKKFDKREQAQFNFIKWIINNGGLAGFCNNAEEVKDILHRKDKNEIWKFKNEQLIKE